MGARKDTNNYEIEKKFWYFRNNVYFCNPESRENIPAVVVKWYTRYFEGVVGVSPCEFDSHLPHKKTSSQGLVFFVFVSIFVKINLIVDL